MDDLEDFYWNLRVGETSFTFVMNECNDGSAWVGDIFRDDGTRAEFDEVIDALAESFGNGTEDADVWLQDALNARLAWQKENG